MAVYGPFPQDLSPDGHLDPFQYIHGLGLDPNGLAPNEYSHFGAYTVPGLGFVWGVGARFEAIIESDDPIEAFEHSFGIDAKNGMYWLKRRYWRKGMARDLCACLEKATPNPNLDMDEFWDGLGPLGHDHRFKDRGQRLIGPMWDPDPTTNMAARRVLKIRAALGPVFDPEFGM